jgi:hypothetical protein
MAAWGRGGEGGGRGRGRSTPLVVLSSLGFQRVSNGSMPPHDVVELCYGGMKLFHGKVKRILAIPQPFFDFSTGWPRCIWQGDTKSRDLLKCIRHYIIREHKRVRILKNG